MPQSGRRPQHQKRTFTHLRPMSALPPITDIPESDWHVRFVPKADSCTAAKRHVIFAACGPAIVELEALPDRSVLGKYYQRFREALGCNADRPRTYHFQFKAPRTTVNESVNLLW